MSTLRVYYIIDVRREWDSMNLRFVDDESSSALFVSIVALLGFNFFYFALAIPFSSVLGNPIFLISYAIWTLLSFLLALREIKETRGQKTRLQSSLSSWRLPWYLRTPESFPLKSHILSLGSSL